MQPTPSSCPLKKSLQSQGRGLSVHLSPQFHLSQEAGWAGVWVPGSMEEWRSGQGLREPSLSRPLGVGRLSPAAGLGLSRQSERCTPSPSSPQP